MIEPRSIWGRNVGASCLSQMIEPTYGEEHEGIVEPQPQPQPQPQHRKRSIPGSDIKFEC